MRLDYTSRFKRQLGKLPRSVQKRVRARIELFLEDQFNSLLNNHKLSGAYGGCRSINVTGDYRIIFAIERGVCLLLEIGTHHELYGN